MYAHAQSCLGATIHGKIRIGLVIIRLPLLSESTSHFIKTEFSTNMFIYLIFFDTNHQYILVRVYIYVYRKECSGIILFLSAKLAEKSTSLINI